MENKKTNITSNYRKRLIKIKIKINYRKEIIQFIDG